MLIDCIHAIKLELRDYTVAYLFQ